MAADIANLGNECRRRMDDLSWKPQQNVPRGPETAAVLQGSLDPSVSYGLVTGGQGITNKLNIQIRTKSANRASVLSASSEMVRP